MKWNLLIWGAFAWAGLSSAQAQTCGLEGSLEHRINDCQRRQNVVVVNREQSDESVTVADAHPWDQVAVSPAGVEAWLSVETNQIYARPTEQKVSWHRARQLCASLRFGDMEGFRLPSVAEMRSAFEAGIDILMPGLHAEHMFETGGLDHSVFYWDEVMVFTHEWTPPNRVGFGRLPLRVRLQRDHGRRVSTVTQIGDDRVVCIRNGAGA